MPAGYAHKSVLLGAVLEALRPHPGGVYADGTLGGAGHAEAILHASSPSGKLYGCDRDAVAIAAARERLAPFGQRVDLRQGNFSELSTWIAPGSCDGVLLDLGVSSPQLDVAERGFSFQADGPLDMRMDAGQTKTAADIVNGTAPEDLARLFWELGGERESRRLARAIARVREQRPLTTTRQLAEVVEQTTPRHGKKAHPATKVFQALRMAVNDELGSLQAGLNGAVRVLKPGGRLAVITFHSLEDRMVKNFGRERSRDYAFTGPVDVPELRTPVTPVLRWVTRKAITPDAEELAENPRSRSAQLRVLEKL